MFNVFNLNNIHAYLNSLILINFQIGAVRSNCPWQVSSQAAHADIMEVDEKRGEEAPPLGGIAYESSKDTSSHIVGRCWKEFLGADLLELRMRVEEGHVLIQLQLLRSKNSVF